MLVFGVTGRIEGAVKFTVDQRGLALSSGTLQPKHREALAQQHAQDRTFWKALEASNRTLLNSGQY